MPQRTYVPNCGVNSANRVSLVKQTTKEFAREMRLNMTEAERCLWELVRRNSLGVRVRRQAVVHGYIADFWCASASLVIEVDGGYHSTRQVNDARRDANLGRKGILTIRFTNQEVMGKPGYVLGKITQIVHARRDQHV